MKVAIIGAGMSGLSAANRLVSDTAPGSAVASEPFDAVIMAIPAPQIGPLAESAGVRFVELAGVRYAPCLTLMLAFQGATDLRAPSLSPQQGPIAWIARNHTKPGRASDAETMVVHATPAWSRAHLDDAVDSTADALLRALRPYLGDAVPAFRMVHRWLYARVEQTAGVPFLWDPVRRVGACGDWAGGPRVEAAFASGEALAAAIIDALG